VSETRVRHERDTSETRATLTHPDANESAFGIEGYKFHVEQSRLYHSDARFKITGAGRRSGKTGIHKKMMYEDALAFPLPGGRFFFCAPTHEQVKNIYWKDLKQAFPRELLMGPPRESDLSVHLINDATIRCIGMDKPERAEGQYIDGANLDEFADMKPSVWTDHIRAGLSSPGRPPGWARFLGVPDFRGPHFRDLFRKAQDPDMMDWEAFHWLSADILDPAEIAAAKRDLDPMIFRQEYEASFEIASGRAYYCFLSNVHAAEKLSYHPHEPLRFAFDFNVDPGIAVVIQDQNFRSKAYPREERPLVADRISAVIGEVYIPRGSNTQMVCRRLVKDWGSHAGNVICYGDASGGNRHTSQRDGSDWDQIKEAMRDQFGGRVSFDVPKANGSERERINSLNRRLRTNDKRVHMLICPTRAPRTAEDLELTGVVSGGTGELDKSDKARTHLTDALGYYAVRAHPAHERDQLLNE
jgi:hypothetical protein